MKILFTLMQSRAGQIFVAIMLTIFFIMYMRWDAVGDFANELRAKAYRDYEEHGKTVDEIIKGVEDAEKETLRELLRQFGVPSGL